MIVQEVVKRSNRLAREESYSSDDARWWYYSRYHTYLNIIAMLTKSPSINNINN